VTELKLRVNFPSLITPAIFAIAFFVAFWIFSRLFEEISILYLGTLFSICIFFFYQLLTLKNNTARMVLRFRKSTLDYVVLYPITMMSIVSVVFIPPYEGSILQWMNVPLLNWLRYLSSLLLTSFLPGYFILRVLDREDSITGSTIIVLSYLLSMFMVFIIGFIILLSGNTIRSLGTFLTIIITIFCILIYHICCRKKSENILTVDPLETGFILSVLLAIEGASTIVMINNLPLTPGDMSRHHGFALQFLDHFPVYGGKLLTGYPTYLFHIYLAMLFTLAGIPSPLAEQGLYVFSFVPILAFYSLVKNWFSEEDDKLPLIAIMLSILLGFGGLYALYLKFTDATCYDITQLLGLTTSKTYDIYMRVLYLPDIVAPLWNVGLPTFFTLLLFVRKRMPR